MLRKFFASFVIFLFAISVVPFLFVTQLYGTLSDEDFYKEELVEESYYLFIEEFPERVDLSDFPKESKEEFRELLEKVFKPEDLGFIVVSVVDQVKNLEPYQSETEIKIPLAQLNDKRDLLAEELTDFLYNKLPECQSDEVVTGLEDIKDFQCLPRNLAKIDFQNRLALELDNSVFSKLPGQYILTFSLPIEFQEDPLKMVNNVFGIFFIIGLTWLALLLGIIALIIRRPWKKIMKWEMAAVVWAFGFHVIFISLFKAMGFVHGIVSQNVDMTSGENFGLDFVLRLLDFVLDKSITAFWMIFVAFISMILWFVFAVWGADGSDGGQKHKNLK